MENQQKILEEKRVLACRSFKDFCAGRGLNGFNPRLLRGIFEQLRLSPVQVLEELESEENAVNLWSQVPEDTKPSLNSLHT